MDRQIPNVWNIFSLAAGPDPNQRQQISNQPQHYRHQPQQQHHQNFHLNWSTKSQDLLHKWCDRSSPCDRPRTYDKFYHKLPGNFIDPSGSTSKSLCSSDADEPNTASSETADTSRKKKRRKKSDRKYSRTITERDVRHLDRHLSMKKTIRKKIMRDLQQAFVQDNETPDNLDLNCLNFDPNKKAVTDANILDLLKSPNPNSEQDPDSGHGTDPAPSPGLISVDQRASKSVRKSGPVAKTSQVTKSGQAVQQKGPKSYLVSDSSSCGGYESTESEKDIIVLAAEHMHAYDQIINSCELKNQQVSSSRKATPKPAEKTTSDNTKIVKPKKSFWQKLTANLKPSNSSSS